MKINPLVRCLLYAVLIVASTGAHSQMQQTGKATGDPPGHPVPSSGAIPGGSTSIRVESVPPIEINSDASQAFGVRDWAPGIGGLLGLVGALAAVWMGMRNTRITIEAGQRNADAALETARRTNEASLWQKANETELTDIQAKLDGFYGPFMQMSEANGLLSQELRDRQPDRETHRLISKVFDKHWLDQLSVGDRAIVREICQNAAVLERFIRDKAAMVDDKLSPYLSRASAHYRILNLAQEGKLGTDPTNFLVYIYPYQLTNVLRLEIERLKNRCAQLRAMPYSALGPIPALNIPADRDHQLPAWPSPPRAPIEVARGG
jgi:hypothetical protein